MCAGGPAGSPAHHVVSLVQIPVVGSYADDVFATESESDRG